MSLDDKLMLGLDLREVGLAEDWEAFVPAAQERLRLACADRRLGQALRTSVEELVEQLESDLLEANELAFQVVYEHAIGQLLARPPLPTGLGEGHPFRLQASDLLDEAKVRAYAKALEEDGQAEAARHVEEHPPVVSPAVPGPAPSFPYEEPIAGPREVARRSRGSLHQCGGAPMSALFAHAAVGPAAARPATPAGKPMEEVSAVSNGRRSSGRKMVSLLLLGAFALLLAVSPGLAGCRKAEPQGGGTLAPFRVVVSDHRGLYPRTSCGYETAEYLDTRVSPGQDVLIGEGDFSINLYWATRVTMEGIQPYIVVDPPPTGGWNWMPEWTVSIVPESTVGSALQLSYWQDQFTVPEFHVTLKAGLSLGGTETLAQDFVFTITRAPEPIMTASVTGFAWAKTPYDRLVAGYVLPAGRYEVRFEFSPAPDPTAAERALLAAAQGVIESRWADDHTFVVILDLASGADEAVFNVNGVAVPGTICLARIEPLVLAGKEKTALACFEDPGNPSCEPKLTALPLPLDAGKMAIGGERALLRESVRNLDISEDGPDVVPVPWVVDTRTGEARCLEGPFESDPIGMTLGMYGWVADGRLALPLRDGSTVMPDLGSSSLEGGDWPIIEANAMDIGPCLSRSVSPDGRRLAWLELKVDALGSSGTMRLVVADPATRQRVEDYPAAAPAVLYDGETWQRPPILWSPVGSICLPPQETLRAAQFRVLDEAGGVFVTRQFLAPDGKPLEALSWTVHSGPEDWLANGRAAGYEVGTQELVLVSASGRRPLGLTREGDPGPILGAAFSPDGSLLAVQAGKRAFLFRCPSGEKVREVEGQYLGFAAGGQLWLVVPAAGD